MLIIALLFIAYVGVVSAAVFRYAQVTQVQHHATATTASTHAPSEGAALYALVDSSRPDAPVCATNGGGDLTFASGEVLRYRVAANGCNGVGGGSSNNAGQRCALCILQPDGATSPFVTNRSVTLAGEVDMNGTASFGSPSGSLCSKKLSSDSTCTGTIVDHNGNLNDPGFSPKPTDPGKVLDPFSGVYQMPPTGTAAGTVSGGIAHAGLYTSLSNAALCPGTYVITGTAGFGGGLSMAPAGSCTGIAGDGVTIVLACGSGATWRSCSASGEAGGGASLQGSGSSITLNAPSGGAYANLVVFADPHNTSSLGLHGNGALTLSGSVYAPSMTYSTLGQNNAMTVQNGRVVIGYVNLQLSNNSIGVSLSGTTPAGVSCNVYSDTLTVTGTTTTSQGHVVMQTACNGGNQIVSFDYQP